MESSEARTFAQVGGALLLVSLALPFFAISWGVASSGFRLWRFDHTACILIGVYGLLAIAQIKLSSRDAMAMIYLICGGLFTAALIYRIWISPPASASIGDLGEVKDFLDAVGIEMKTTYGAYVATLGSVFVTVGAYLEFRSAGEASSSDPATLMQQAQAVPASQRYQPPTPQAYAPVQNEASTVPPDPFAPPGPPAV